MPYSMSLLALAQQVDALVGCAGCGRKLEVEFMELDHIQPKGENGPNHIINRILLCRPCNGRKSDQFTMAELRRQNRQAGWMKYVSLAELMQDSALIRTTWLRDNWERRGEAGL